jgi:amidase
MLPALLAAAAVIAAPAQAVGPPTAQDEKSVAALQADMAAGKLTSEALVNHQLTRIRALDRTGPALHSIGALSPTALSDARAIDAARKAGKLQGPLAGVTVVAKDLIDIRGLPTTGGSLALKDNVVSTDAPAIARLRAAGAVILGKAATSEWANARSSQVISGFSGMVGLTRNPYVLDRDASGSSSGSGVAVSAGLSTLAIGTDTTGSVIGPGGVNGIVSLRPTTGLIPRTGVIPFSDRMDTIGPMGRHVADVATMLTVMAGSDPADARSAPADAHKTDYAKGLRADALKGVRLGVLRFSISGTPQANAVFDQALAALRAQGAVIVEIKDPPPEPDDAAMAASAAPPGRGESHWTYDNYLSHTNPKVSVRSLADLVAFNKAHPREELGVFGQEILETALASPAGQPTPDSIRRADLRDAQARERVDSMLRTRRVDAIIAPTNAPSPRFDFIARGSNGVASLTRGARNMNSYAAQAAYPLLTVPMGAVQTMPVGLSFLGPAWSEDRLLAYGYAFEQATHARKPPQFTPSLETTPEAIYATSPHDGGLVYPK